MYQVDCYLLLFWFDLVSESVTSFEEKKKFINEIDHLISNSNGRLIFGDQQLTGKQLDQFLFDCLFENLNFKVNQ